MDAEARPEPDAAAVEAQAQTVAQAVAPAAPRVAPFHPGLRTPRPPGTSPTRANAQLLPTLFDRLRDDAPSQTQEAPGDYVVSPSQMRDILQRDLGWLLNTTNAEDLIDRLRFPEAAASCLNFGVPALAGSYLSQRPWDDIERLIRRAIFDYEPRLIPESVTVAPLMREGAGEDYNVLVFEIRALIALQPYPLELTVHSSVDLETNRISLVSASRGPARAGR